MNEQIAFPYAHGRYAALLARVFEGVAIEIALCSVDQGVRSKDRGECARRPCGTHQNARASHPVAALPEYLDGLLESATCQGSRCFNASVQEFLGLRQRQFLDRMIRLHRSRDARVGKLDTPTFDDARRAERPRNGDQDRPSRVSSQAERRFSRIWTAPSHAIAPSGPLYHNPVGFAGHERKVAAPAPWSVGALCIAARAFTLDPIAAGS
jgi:hypothetical protein